MASQPRAATAELMERVAERPDHVRMRDRDYRFDEAERSASSLSVSVPSGGPVQALPGASASRFREEPAVEAGEPI